ncbi:MAG: hypothetical protein IJS93_01520 [Clostridia bacterium]|nr:hypothetical protein [Clostridia bacterium]
MVLGEVCCIKIDHKIGSVDENGLYYPINVGYISKDDFEDTRTIVYLLGVTDPVTEYNGEYIALVKCLGEEDKIVCAPFGFELSNDQIAQEISFIDPYCSIERPVNI